MRILAIGDLLSFRLGGAEAKLERLVKFWVDHGAIVTVAGMHVPEGNIRIHGRWIRGRHIRSVKSHGRMGRALSYSFSLARILLEEGGRHDLVYAVFLGEAALVTSLLKRLRLLRIPLICCPASPRDGGDVEFIRSIPLWRLWRQLLLKSVEHLQIIAPGIDAAMREFGFSSERFLHIPNPVEIPDISADHESSEYPTIIFAGRLSHEKGLDLMLRALSSLHNEGIKFRLKILGDGPELDNLKRQSVEGRIQGLVRFEGRKNSDAVQSELLGADLFVLPSLYEGLSNAALEALSCGIPVVLTRCNGVDCYIDERTGWLCDPGDAEGLLESLRQAITASCAQRRLMGKAARELIRSRFSLDLVGRRLLNSFETIKCRKVSSECKLDMKT